jgi:predicted transcriptional regulator
MEKKLVPYSIYLPVEYIEKLKVLAKERKASSMIRDAIALMLEGNNKHLSGYKKGLRDAIKVIKQNKECEIIAIKGKPLSAILADQINQLEE